MDLGEDSDSLIYSCIHIYTHIIAHAIAASARVLAMHRCTATYNYVMIMAINMKELASVSCKVKGINFYSGMNSFSSFDDLQTLKIIYLS